MKSFQLLKHSMLASVLLAVVPALAGSPAARAPAAIAAASSVPLSPAETQLIHTDVRRLRRAQARAFYQRLQVLQGRLGQRYERLSHESASFDRAIAPLDKSLGISYGRSGETFSDADMAVWKWRFSFGEPADVSDGYNFKLKDLRSDKQPDSAEQWQLYVKYLKTLEAAQSDTRYYTKYAERNHAALLLYWFRWCSTQGDKSASCSSPGKQAVIQKWYDRVSAQVATLESRREQLIRRYSVKTRENIQLKRLIASAETQKGELVKRFPEVLLGKPAPRTETVTTRAETDSPGSNLSLPARELRRQAEEELAVSPEPVEGAAAPAPSRELKPALRHRVSRAPKAPKEPAASPSEEPQELEDPGT